MSLPFSSYYLQNYSPECVSKLVKREQMHHYMYRGKGLKRAPKNEFYYPGNEHTTYKWGQQKTMYPGGEAYTGKVMPPWMVCMADHIRHSSDQLVNHAIIIKYDSGTKTHAPPHMDKVPKDTSFFVFSYGKPRRFDVLDTKLVESEDEKKRDSSGNPVKKHNKDGSVKTKMVPSTVCWSKELEHNSLLVIDGQTNDNYYHAIPKDKGWKGERWSLIFRTIE
jgi:alkylated DNA repair dioxygenase AlkB